MFNDSSGSDPSGPLNLKISKPRRPSGREIDGTPPGGGGGGAGVLAGGGGSFEPLVRTQF